jgi:hypothetical protein
VRLFIGVPFGLPSSIPASAARALPRDLPLVFGEHGVPDLGATDRSESAASYALNLNV